MCCAYVWTGAMHIVHGVTRTEINLSSKKKKKTFSQLQTGQGCLKYRSNLKNVLPSPYIFFTGGVWRGGENLEERCEEEAKMEKSMHVTPVTRFYFYNILSYLKMIYATYKIISPQPCLSSHVNFCYHKKFCCFYWQLQACESSKSKKTRFCARISSLDTASPRTLFTGYLFRWRNGVQGEKKKFKGYPQGYAVNWWKNRWEPKSPDA